MALLITWLTVSTLALGLLTLAAPRHHTRTVLYDAAALWTTLAACAYLLTR